MAVGDSGKSDDARAGPPQTPAAFAEVPPPPPLPPSLLADPVTDVADSASERGGTDGLLQAESLDDRNAWPPAPPPVAEQLLQATTLVPPPVTQPPTPTIQAAPPGIHDANPKVGTPLPPPVALDPEPPPQSAAAATATRLGGPSDAADDASQLIVALQEDAEEDEDDGNIPLARTLKAAPPWLISCLVHTLLMLVLGLITYSVSQQQPEIVLEVSSAEEFGEQPELEMFSDESLIETNDFSAFVAEDLDLVEEPLISADAVTLSPDGFMAVEEIEAPKFGMMLSGREPGMKQALLAAYGGSDKTEAAVLAGLRWLVRQQDRDGLWSLSGRYGAAAQSRGAVYASGAKDENKSGATGLALLAFQGYGQTHQGGPYEDLHRTVKKGVSALLARQHANGSFTKGITSSETALRDHHAMYTQAICTLALCELYAMTGDETLKEPAQRAIDYIVERQQSEGGWRYAGGSDLSVTGWVMMALQSARMAELKVPRQTLYRIEQYLDKVSSKGGSRYAYDPRRRWSLAMTAEGLLCRQYLGWRIDNEDLVDGALLLIDNRIDDGYQDVYYWYYATQVLHNMEGDYWKAWNEHLSTRLPALQEKQGTERGSWSPEKDAWGQAGGRLYTTCLAICMLEVYYRHLPIYSQNFNLSLDSIEAAEDAAE